MANLPEVSNFDEGVYQWEITDPVAGGATGIANTPLKNLVNRTRWLKDQIANLLTAIGLLAPINSPTFTGSPHGVTPDQAAAGTEIVTAAWVGGALGITNRRAVSFTSSTTWTVPAGVTKVKATVVGAGGGGSNSGSTTPGSPYSSGAGGGAGALTCGIYTVTPGQVISITVGAGGGSQQGGGTSSFGSFSTATGGGPGSNSTATSAGGVGGAPVGGNNYLNLYGGYGSDGQSGAFTGMGNGAPGPWGGGGRAAASNGVGGQAPGAGGGASYNGTAAGGQGASGIVIIEY